MEKQHTASAAPETTGAVTEPTDKTQQPQSAPDRPDLDPQPDTTVGPTQETETSAEAYVDIETLVSEAEERGYRRGLNEAIERQMNGPVLFDDLARRRNDTRRTENDNADALASGFLSGIRPGVWD